jgi:hypothetical protein
MRKHVYITWQWREINIELLLEQVKEREHLKDLVVNGKNVKMDIKWTGWEGVVLIDLAQDRDVVNTLINPGVP